LIQEAGFQFFSIVYFDALNQSERTSRVRHSNQIMFYAEIYFSTKTKWKMTRFIRTFCAMWNILFIFTQK